MEARSTVIRAGNYRRPHVSPVVSGHNISSGKDDVEEEEEWSDDDSASEPPKSPRDKAPRPQSHTHYGYYNQMPQPTRDHTLDPHHGPWGPGDSARGRHSNMSSNSPGGQAVPYGSHYPASNPFAPAMPGQGQQYFIPSSQYHQPHEQYIPPPTQYYPPHPPYIPPPLQSYPSAYPEVESIRQELEDLRIESREMERRMEKKRAEEIRRKKKKAELEQKRKAKLEEEAKMQQLTAHIDEKIRESVSRAARRNAQPADLHGVLSNSLPPQTAAAHYGHGYGYNAQGESTHELSARMRRPDFLADEQGPSNQYHNGQPSMGDLCHQLYNMEQCLFSHGKIISTLLSHEQRSAGQFTDREYHPPYGPGHRTLQPVYSLAATSSSNQPDPFKLIRSPRKARGGGPRNRGLPPTTGFFGVEEPAENVGRWRNNYSSRKYPFDDDDDDSDGENVAYAAVASRPVDRNQQAAEKAPRSMRKQQPSSHEKPKASENNNVMSGRKNVAVRRTNADGVEYGVDLGHSSDASDEVEEHKPRPTQYLIRPDERFRREVFQPSNRRPQPFEQFTYGDEDHASRYLAPSPPLTANGDCEVR